MVQEFRNDKVELRNSNLRGKVDGEETIRSLKPQNIREVVPSDVASFIKFTWETMSEAHSNARRYKAPLPPCRGEELLEFFKIMELKPKILIAATDRLRRHRWRILIIDREFPRQLIIQEDPSEYTEEECRAQLNSMIALGG